jgi:hypothetical protein
LVHQLLHVCVVFDELDLQVVAEGALGGFQLTSEEPDRLMYRLEGAVLPYQGFLYIFGLTKAAKASPSGA